MIGVDVIAPAVCIAAAVVCFIRIIAEQVRE